MVKMPSRQPKDGAVAVSRLDSDFIALDATYGGDKESLVVSEYNAWRLFGLLSVMLGLPLTKKVSKAIHLGGYGPGSVTFSRPLPNPAGLGDELAAEIAHTLTVEAMRVRGYNICQ